MKNFALLFGFALSFFFLVTIFSTSSCRKDSPDPEPPKADTIFFTIEGVEVSNGKVTSLGYNTVKFQGEFKKLQASTFKIVDYGYVVSSVTNKPTVDNNEGISHKGERNVKGAFDSEISPLAENKTYYARVYLKREIIATGDFEYGYHPFSISFTTKSGSPPIITNLETKNITKNSFQLNSLISDENLLTISQYGHIWSTNPNPDINSPNKTIYGPLQSVFTHQFSSDISNLAENTNYYIRAYAINQFGVGYSQTTNVLTDQTIVSIKADFDFSPNLNIQSGAIVTFNNLSSASASNFNWDFGDGTYSQDKNPQKTFSSVGEYQVKLISSDATGFNKDSIVKSVYVMSANIVYYPLNGGSDIIADITPVAFSSPYDGFSSSSWNFGNGEGTSSEPSLNYTFNSEGTKIVTLSKSGPGGLLSESKQIKVWATGPCHNRDFPNNHSIDNIQFINNNGLLQTGTIKIDHNYGGCASITLYHPTSWSSGDYTPWSGFAYQICTGLSPTFYISPNNPLYLGGDWGIKITFPNGVESCIRTLRNIGIWNNNEFIVLSSKIFEGQ